MRFGVGGLPLTCSVASGDMFRVCSPGPCCPPSRHFLRLALTTLGKCPKVSIAACTPPLSFPIQQKYGRLEEYPASLFADQYHRGQGNMKKQNGVI